MSYDPNNLNRSEAYAAFRAQAAHAVEVFNVTTLVMLRGRVVAYTFDGGVLAQREYARAIYGRTNDNEPR